MRAQIRVPLKKPFEGHKGRVTEIVLQEPSGSDYFALGEPKTWVRAPGGMALIENDEAIKAYVARCIVEPDPVLAMSQMHFKDARKVKEAVLDFFQEEATAKSESSPTISSLSSESSTPNPAAS